MLPSHGRLLTVACSQFGDPAGGGMGYPPLPFSGPLADQLIERLGGFGYDPAARFDELPANELGQRVEQFLDGCEPHEIVIVHIIGHGLRSKRTAKLLVVGSDGRTAPQTDVERWLTAVEDRTDDDGEVAAPRVLFLVDLCYAGTITSLPWQGDIPDEDRRAWVIAATAQQDPAYGGRFTRAVNRVLERIAAGGLDIAPTYPHVPIEKVAREIRREVDRLSEGSYQQRVVSIRSDPASIPDFPFIPNPAYNPAPDSLQLAGSKLDEMARPFLDGVDEGLDWRHFASRAAGGGRPADIDLTRAGAFRGRRRELRLIAEVLDAAAPKPCLILVTGSPGVGKSALLGITVCAAHPDLADVTEPLWRDHRDQLPAVHEGLVAVHCRQRHLHEIVASIARQVSLPISTADAATLLVAIEKSRVRPAIVLDALDEAMDPYGVMSALIVPLMAVARVIVGVRPWLEFVPLREAAAESGLLIDLDTVPVAELRRDLAAYVDDLLRPTYRTAELRATRQVIAAGVADILTEQRSTEPAEPDPRDNPDWQWNPRVSPDRWGEFLVAGLFAHQLRDRPAITELSEAAAVARTVPRTLPEVFELDLRETGAEDSLQRHVLTTLALSFGAGMPRSLIECGVGVFVGEPASDRDVADALDASRFYLRRETGEYGVTRYRLFHQGLADHLRARAIGARPNCQRELFTSLLADLGTPARWSLADPYLLRHAVDHAVQIDSFTELLNDLGYLTHGDPQSISARLSAGVGRRAEMISRVYRESFPRHASLGPDQRRSTLTIDAHRLGYLGFAAELSDVIDLPPPGWRVRWATSVRSGARIHPAVADYVTLGGSEVRPFVAFSGRSGLSIVDVAAGVRTRAVRGYRPFHRCLAVGRVGDRALVCMGSEWGAIEIRDAWDQAVHATIQLEDPVTWAKFIAGPGNVGYLVVHAGSAVKAWDVGDWTQVAAGYPVRLLGTGVLDDHPVVLTSGGLDVSIHAIPGGELLSRIDTGDQWITTAATGTRADRPIVVFAVQYGTVAVWDVRDRAEVRRLDDAEQRAVTGLPDGWWSPAPEQFVTAVALDQLDGVAVTFAAYSDGSLAAWDVASGRRRYHVPSVFPGSGLQSLLPARLAGLPVLLAAGPAGVAVCDAAQGNPMSIVERDEPEPEEPAGSEIDETAIIGRRHSGAVRSVTFNGDGTVLASASKDASVQLWDPLTGTTGLRLEGHTDWLNSVALGRFRRRPVVLSGGTDCTARLWNLRRGSTMCVLSGHKGWIRAVAFGRYRGDTVGVTAAHDGTVRVWDLDTGNCVSTLPVPGSALTCVATGEVDGRQVIVAGGTSRSAYLWEADSGELLTTFDGHDRTLWTVALAEVDGRPVVLTGSEDRTVRVWNAVGGGQLRSFSGFRAGVTAIATGEWQGRQVLLAGSEDCTVMGWDLDSGGLFTEAAFPGTIGSLALSASGLVAVGFSNDVAVIQLAR